MDDEECERKQPSGPEGKVLHKQAGYMRAMIFSYIAIKCLANGVGPYMYVGRTMH